MSAPPPELDEAERWEREANEDLRTAEVIAAPAFRRLHAVVLNG